MTVRPRWRCAGMEVAARLSVAIRVDHLTKSHRGVTAVDDVSFCARPGRVTGFLGPNGAGKSTTMRIMVGLSTRDRRPRGRPRQPVCRPAQPGSRDRRVAGCLAQHAGRTGREILELRRADHGAAGQPRARDAAPGVVDGEGKPIGGSAPTPSVCGQRLGIATALIGDPGVLCPMSPPTASTPAGIRWMRDVLREFADQGGTVLLSSHLLHEIEVIADDPSSSATAGSWPRGRARSAVDIGNGRCVVGQRPARRHPRPRRCQGYTRGCGLAHHQRGPR